MKVRDKVEVVDESGNKIAEGVIYNINDFRESNMKYAVDIEGYDDFFFAGESQLRPVNDNSMSLEEYLNFFEDKKVPIQITLDIGKQPTVHALYSEEEFERYIVKVTEADTLLEALEKMKVKLFV